MLTNQYGLPEDWFTRSIGVLAAHPKVERVLVFGSRARGDFRPTSDLDLALDAPAMTRAEFAGLRMNFEEQPFILKTDLIWLQDSGDALRANILKFAREAYRRTGVEPVCEENP